MITQKGNKNMNHHPPNQNPNRLSNRNDSCLCPTSLKQPGTTVHLQFLGFTEAQITLGEIVSVFTLERTPIRPQ